MNKETALHWFLYDKESGNIFWKRRSAGRMAGSIAGSLSSRGYIVVCLHRKIYPAHRIIWLMHHGEMPNGDIDHINRIKTDNRIENLRVATKSDNQKNHSISIRNKSGFKNVSWCRYAWEVSLRVGGKKFHFGIYHDIELADLVAREAREKYHGEFCCHK